MTGMSTPRTPRQQQLQGMLTLTELLDLAVDFIGKTNTVLDRMAADNENDAVVRAALNPDFQTVQVLMHRIDSVVNEARRMVA